MIRAGMPAFYAGVYDGGTPEPRVLRKYVFSTDHKVVGLQYALTSMLFLLVGFTLVLIIRWQLAYPGRPLPHPSAQRTSM